MCAFLFPEGRSDIDPFVPNPLIEPLVRSRRFETAEGFDVRTEFEVVETRRPRIPRHPRKTSSARVPGRAEDGLVIGN